MSNAPASEHRDSAPPSIAYALLTLSDSRSLAEDRSGDAIVARMQAAGHRLVARRLVSDDIETIRRAVGESLETPSVQALVVTGGTGMAPRDQTPEAIAPLLEAELPGFGELFRMLSYQEIGAAAMLSRAFAGRIGRQPVFCLPGSTNAVRLAVDALIAPELAHLVALACRAR